MLKNIKTESTASKEMGWSGVKLPKVSVPTFDGKVLSWISVCEQFDATIQGKAGLSITDKLTYLQGALKDGSASFVIEGWTRTFES